MQPEAAACRGRERRYGPDFATDADSSDGRRFTSQVVFQGLVAGDTGGLVLCVGFFSKMSMIPLDFLYLLVYNMEPLRVNESFRRVSL